MHVLHSPTAPKAHSHAPLWWWVAAILLLTFWLGTRELNSSLWIDEYKSILDSGGGPFERRTPLDIWNGVAARHGVHPPGYYVILSVWGALTGWEPPILRALSLFAGILTTAWTYRLGRDLLSVRGGIYAAAVVGTSGLFVHYLHELRMYTLLALFTTMTLWHYLYLMNSRSRPRAYHWVGFLFAAAAALYMQYFAIPLLGAIGIYHLGFAPLLKRRWRGVNSTAAIAGLLFAPWLLSGISRGIGVVARNEDLHERALTAPEVVQLVLELFSNGSVILLALAGMAALFALVRLRDQAVRLWYFAVVTLAFILAINFALELIAENRIRYTILMWPLLALLVSLGIVTLERWLFNRVQMGRILAGGFMAAWLVNGVSYTLSAGFTYPEFPFHNVTGALHDRVQEHDMIILVSNDPRLEGTASYGELISYYLHPLAVDRKILTASERRDELQQALLQSLVDEPRSVIWLVHNPQAEPTYLPTAQAMLNQRYALCSPELAVEGAHIQEYAAFEVCCSSERDLSTSILHYTNGIALLNVAPLPDTLTSETLEVSALWHVPPEVPANAYSVSFQVYDAARVKVAQADVALDAVAFACASVEVALPALDAGDYTLEAVVYAWETGERLTATRADDGTVSELQELAAFDVP